MGAREIIEQAHQGEAQVVSAHRCIIDGMPHPHREWVVGCVHCRHEY